MESKQRLLIITGLVLILCGLLFGLLFNYSVEHNTHSFTKDNYEPVFLALAEVDSQWQPLLDKINKRAQIYTRAIDVHTHSINMGLLLMLLAMLYPLLQVEGQSTSPHIFGLTISAWIYPLGLALQMSQWEFAGEITSAIGACIFIISLAMLFFRVKKNIDDISVK